MRSQTSVGFTRLTPTLVASLAALALAAPLFAQSPTAAEPAAPPPGAPAPGAGDSAGRVVARVNGEPLYAEDVASVLGEIHRSQEIQQRSTFDLDQLMFRVVNDMLLAQEARAMGMDQAPEIQRKLELRRESKARARVYREEIVNHLDPSDAKIRAVYDDVYRMATLRIFTKPDRADAEKVRPRVLAAKDEESFAKLAGAESEDSYKGRGGKVHAPLTDLYRSIIEFATKAKPGDLSQPLATPWGWSLVRLVELEPADPAQLEARRGRVLVELRYRQEAALRAALAEKLKPSLGLEVDWPVYESVTIERMHDGRLLPKFEKPERVVARVAGRTITVESFAGKLSSAWSSLGNSALAAEYKPAAFDDLIFEQLLVAEGLRRGYGDTPEVRRELHALEVSQLASHYLKETVTAGLDVTPQEARAYYDAHVAQFRKAPKLHLLQLTVATKEEGERLAGLVKTGSDFAWLARQFSTDEFRSAGGERGWILATQPVQPFNAELADAKAGDVIGPKKSAEGWMLVKVDLYEDQGVHPFEAVSGNVRDRVVGEKIGQRISEIIQKLRERSEIWVDKDAVAAMELVPTAPEASPAMPGHDQQ